MKSQVFPNKVFWRLDLATGLSREFKSWANGLASLGLLSCSGTVGVTLQLLACLACVYHFGGLQSWATHEIQPWVPVSLHSLEQFFTLSHTLHLHDSHLNTGLPIAKIQANLARNKANKMVDKIQPYNLPIWLFRNKTLKQTLCELGIVEHNSFTPNSRNCEALESYEHESPETQKYTMIIVCRKAWNAYEASMIWSSKDGV